MLTIGDKFPAFKLTSYNTPIHAGVSYHLKVVTAGINIKVYFNNNAAPVIDVNDTTYLSGYFGLNVYQSTGIFQNIYRHVNP